MRAPERYVRKRRDDFRQDTPFAGYVVMFAAGFTLAGMILLLAFVR